MSTGAFTLADVDRPSKGRFSSADIGASDLGEGTVTSNKFEHAAGKALQGAGLPTSIANIPDWFKHLTGSAKDSEPWWNPVSKAVKEPTQENIVGAVPFIGQMSVSMAKDAKEGNYMDASATMLGALSLLKMAGQVKPGTTAAKQQLLDMTRTAQNELTPGIKAVSSIAKVVGGPEIADAVLPSRPPLTDFKGGAFSEFAGESGKATPISKSPNFDPAAYRAGAAERTTQTVATTTNPFAGATPTNISIGNLKLPEPGAGTTSSTGGLPQGNTTPFVSKFTTPEASPIVSPLSPAPPINRTLVSYDRQLLVHMARGGDLNALRELIRNPSGIDVASAVPNSKYLLEEGAPTNIYGGPKK